MDVLVSLRTGHDLYRVVAPRAHLYGSHPAATGREQTRVPRKQPLRRQHFVVVPCRVEHHLDNAFDVSVGWFEASGIHPEAAGNGRPDSFGIEYFSFNGA